MAQRGRPGPQSARGDFTGRQKEVLQKEHEAAVDERRNELGLISAGQQQVKDEGVIDLMSGEPVLEGTDQLVDAAARQPSVVDREQENPEGERIGSSTAKYEVLEMPAEKPQAAVQKGEVLTKDMLMTPTLIRSLYDLEDVTIGYGNTFTFREGYRYKVPRWVAGHLEEKGLALVLSLSA
jgi:hypothetical protein